MLIMQENCYLKPVGVLLHISFQVGTNFTEFICNEYEYT